MSAVPILESDELDEPQNGQSMTYLYRHFDGSGALLYVGISLSALTRLQQHNQCSHWFADIRSITIEKFDSREAAVAAETRAIQNESPAYNIMMTDRAGEIRRLRAEESRAEMLRQLVSFQPMYKIAEAADLMRMGEQVIRNLIADGKLGYVVVQSRKLITGWQIIDYIESLQSGKDGE